jgi:hypothetical protein
MAWHREPDAKRLHDSGTVQTGELYVSEICATTGAKGLTACRIVPFLDRL